MKKLLLVFCLAWAAPAASQAQDPATQTAADYQRLKRAYLDAFRTLGRAQQCRVEIPAAPFFAEVARRHGAKSELAALARTAFDAAATNTLMPREVDPTPPAPMPCDVVVYMKDMRLPELPPSLAKP